MIKDMCRRYLLMTAVVSFGLGPALATEQMPRASDEAPGHAERGGDALAHVERGSYRGIPWLSGGVGSDEREAIMAAVSDYNLKLEFANTQGDYLGDVGVVVRNAGGEGVLEIVSSGPWLLARLPAGRYEVRAEAAGRTLSETVSVSRDGMQTVIFNRWSAADTGPAPSATARIESGSTTEPSDRDRVRGD